MLLLGHEYVYKCNLYNSHWIFFFLIFGMFWIAIPYNLKATKCIWWIDYISHLITIRSNNYHKQNEKKLFYKQKVEKKKIETIKVISQHPKESESH